MTEFKPGTVEKNSLSTIGPLQGIEPTPGVMPVHNQKRHTDLLQGVISSSCNKPVKIRSFVDLLQLVEQIATDLHCCHKLSQAKRTHPDIGL